MQKLESILPRNTRLRTVFRQYTQLPSPQKCDYLPFFLSDLSDQMHRDGFRFQENKNGLAIYRMNMRTVLTKTLADGEKNGCIQRCVSCAISDPSPLKVNIDKMGSIGVCRCGSFGKDATNKVAAVIINKSMESRSLLRKMQKE